MIYSEQFLFHGGIFKLNDFNMAAPITLQRTNTTENELCLRDKSSFSAFNDVNRPLEELLGKADDPRFEPFSGDKGDIFTVGNVMYVLVKVEVFRFKVKVFRVKVFRVEVSVFRVEVSVFKVLGVKGISRVIVGGFLRLLALEEVATVDAAALLGVIVFWSAIQLICMTKHSATFLVNTLSNRSKTEAPVALTAQVPILVALAVLVLLVPILVLAVAALAVAALALVVLDLLGGGAEEGIRSTDGTTEYGLWVR